MKTNLYSLPALLLTAAISLASVATSHAQSTAVDTQKLPSPEAMGTIRTVGPDTMVIQADNQGRPLTYRYAHSIQYVDESGKVVNREVLVPGLPVTVEGIREGDSILATRWIVHQQTAKALTTGPEGTTATTATTTTTQDVKKTEAQGILGMWEADRFELRTVKDGAASFLYHKNTEIRGCRRQEHVTTRSRCVPDCR